MIRLGDLLEVVIDHRGKTPKKLGFDYSQRGVPVLSAKVVINGTLDLAEVKHVSPEVWRAWMRTPTRQGDVLLTSEAPLGRLARIPSDEPFVLGQRLFGLRGKGGVLDNRFLFYALQYSVVQDQLRYRATGSTVTGIRQSALMDLTLDLPSWDEQRAIAEVLGALDDKIAADARLIRVADELCDAAFDSMTMGVPLVSVSSVLDPILGGTPARSKREFWEQGQVPWASVGDVAGATGGVITGTRERITQLAAGSTKARPLPAGSVLVTARGTVGKVGWLGNPSAFNQSSYGFVPGVIPPASLYRSLKKALVGVSAHTHGSVFSTITKRTFADLLIPRVEAWEAVESRLAPLHEVIRSSAVQAEGLAGLRDTLLPALMSGRIRVKDAEKTVSEVV